MPYKVGVFVGSLSKQSINRRLARALFNLAKGDLELEEIPIGNLPLYNRDFDSDYPPEGRALKEAIAKVDALMFVTPEYNRSVPGGLKNAIDVGSRPYGDSAFASKPAAVMSISPGALGAFGANHHLRQSLVFLGMPVLQQPEAYVGGAGSLFDDQGDVVESSRPFFEGFIEAFAAWVERITPAEGDL